MRTSLFAARRARGFTLVEVMVGVAIGMVGVLIMFRVTSIWDTHTRTAMAGNDAQTAGTLALFALERDFKNAGHGFARATSQAMGCTVSATDVANARPLPAFQFYPVLIQSAPLAGSNQLTVLYGNSSYFTAAETMLGSTATTKTLRRRGGFRMGDLAVVSANVPGGACDLIEVTDTGLPDGRSIGHGQVAYSSDYAVSNAPNTNSRYNPTAGTSAPYGGGAVFDLGPTPQLNVWSPAVSSPVLTRTNFIVSNTPVTVADGVVGLRAEYGVDSDNSGTLTDTAPNEWTSAAPADWTKVLAIRVALLVRSKQFERTAVAESSAAVAATTAAPTWHSGESGADVAFTMNNADGSPDSFAGAPNTQNPNNWRFYRYRVYQRVIPLRNVIWAQ